ncbi:MAG: hypothetical protein OXG77_02400 [Chloroflexi bacterium]|nr:hypothetical protein [Chloroflexota bacterium]
MNKLTYLNTAVALTELVAVIAILPMMMWQAYFGLSERSDSGGSPSRKELLKTPPASESDTSIESPSAPLQAQSPSIAQV